jgi:NACHT domain-containing protein
VKNSSSNTRDLLLQLQSDLAKLVDKFPHASHSSEHLSQLSHLLTEFIKQGEKATQTHHVLQSLHFSQVNTRYFDVKKAHAKTCQWIFDKTNFIDWLRSSNNHPYWISGKAGSGKSTLMKFICNNPRTMENLQRWAALQNLFLGSHFFWSAGTPMQKSQEGMLQTLLFQTLSQYPDLAPVACPQRWERSSRTPFAGNEPWTMEELFRSFEALASQTQHHCFCFFIDGLDEYDGDHAEIVSIIKKLSSFPSIKCCISSRPWTVFREVYELSPWTLRVQDLTRDDIELYVEDKLKSHKGFLLLQSHNPVDATCLVKDIVRKAEGVFLWVFLVVRSLLRGLTNQDEILDLRRRLNDLPTDLESYFKYIFDSIEPIYRPQTAQVFQTVVAFVFAGRVYSQLPILAYSFFNAERTDSNYAINLKISPYTEHEISNIIEKQRRHIHARCKDLLEVTEDVDRPSHSRYGIDFLHRTVLDFLKTEDIAKLLSSWASPGFSPHSSLCKAFLAHMKVVPLDQGPDDSESTLGKDICTIAIHAKEAEINNNEPEIVLLDEMDRTVSAIKGQSWYSKFIKLSYSLNDEFTNLQSKTQDYLDVMVQLRLTLCVTVKLNDTPERLFRRSGLPLLLYGLVATRVANYQPNYSKAQVFSAIRYAPEPEMVELLLQRGADPNEIVQLSHDIDTTVWGFFLVRDLSSNSNPGFHMNTNDTELKTDVDPAIRSRKSSLYFKACELMIKHGALPQIHSGSVKAIFDKCFTPKQSEELMDMFPKQPRSNDLLGWFRGGR